MTRIGWLDCSSGVSGDMLLGALTDLGVLDDLPDVVAALGVDATVTTGRTRRAGLAAARVTVLAGGSPPARRLADVLAVVAAADVDPEVHRRAEAVFTRLAGAEAAAHGVETSEVHFHEVGAVDAIVDVLGTCLGLHRLGLDDLIAGPIALGGGTARTEHGVLPVPAPAVLHLLRGSGLAAHGGPVDVELATPTGVAVVVEHARTSGPLPAVEVEQVGVGAGGRDRPEQPNAVRLVVGVAAAAGPAASWTLVEANVDDLDPRLWPGVIEALLTAGAADAWLTPIVMKKGRPAHTLAALTTAERAAEVRAAMFRESSTIGVRETPVGKHALDRDWARVDVDGQPVRVKLARLGGEVVSATPEWDDVAAAAAALGRPAKQVLAAAVAAAQAAPAARIARR